jgi:hypothetical protein
MALYTEGERIVTGRENRLEAIMVLVTKEDPPDKAIITFPDDLFYAELTKIQLNLPRIMAVKSGAVEPVRCEHCRYCRETKKVQRIMSFQELAS